MQHTVQQQHIAHSAAYSAAAADCTQCSIIAVQHTMQQTMQQQHNCTQLHICHSSLASWLPGHPRWVQPAALAGSERSLRRRTGSLFCRSSLWALRQPGFTLFCAFSGQNGSACTSRGSSSSSAVCANCSSPSPTSGTTCSSLTGGCAEDWPGCTRRSMASPGQAAQDMPPPAIKQALAGPWQTASSAMIGPWHTGRQAYGDRLAFLEQIASLAAENGLTAEEALARCKAALRSASDVESTASADSDLELATPVQRQM